MPKPIHFSNATIQVFPFRSPYMNYIYKNIKSQHLRKLTKTCKFYVNQFPICALENLTIIDNEEDFGDGESEYDLFECISLARFLKKPNYFLLFGRLEAWDVRVAEKFTKVVGCFLSEVFLSECDSMTLMEFEMLMAGGNVRILSMSNPANVPCVVGDGGPLPIEDILGFAPYASTIKLKPCFSTPQTMTKLLDGRNKKFEALSLYSINGSLDSSLFYEFIKKKVEPEAIIILKFCDPEIGERFRSDVDGLLKSWKSVMPKPKFKCAGLLNNAM